MCKGQKLVAMEAMGWRAPLAVGGRCQQQGGGGSGGCETAPRVRPAAAALLQQHVRLTRGFRGGCKGHAGAATPAGPPCALAALSVGRSALQTPPFRCEQTFQQRVGSQGLRGVSPPAGLAAD